MLQFVFAITDTQRKVGLHVFYYIAIVFIFIDLESNLCSVASEPKIHFQS